MSDSALLLAARELAIRLMQQLEKPGHKMAAAESCTGGLLGAVLTDIAGMSAVYSGGIIAYENRVKEQVLGVGTELLEQYGAVSAPVAEAMARGVQSLLNVEFSVSVTGIAGPGGGSAEKPVGLVYIGVAFPGGTSVSRELFDGDRRAVREQTVARALELLVAAVHGEQEVR